MRYLTELGHRRIVMIVYEPPIHLPTQLRVNAFRSFIEEAGLSDSSLKFADLSRNIGANNIVAKVLDEIWELEGDKPTAIICDSDVSTLAALKWCGDHGIDVPRAVSIVGFDDTRSSRYSKPPLTTVAQPIAEIAKKAVDLAESSEDIHILIAPTLIVRGTAAVPHTIAET
jgi:LacI family transcriptional regulator